jgi:hypothetical protein
MQRGKSLAATDPKMASRVLRFLDGHYSVREVGTRHGIFEELEKVYEQANDYPALAEMYHKHIALMDYGISIKAPLFDWRTVKPKLEARLQSLKESAPDKWAEPMDYYKWDTIPYKPSLPLSPTRDELQSVTREARLVRNEIYARHNYPFQAKDLQMHFAKKSWYQPIPGIAVPTLTMVERANVQCLQELEAIATVSEKDVVALKLEDWRKRCN